jgi:hypothetical protein
MSDTFTSQDGNFAFTLQTFGTSTGAITGEYVAKTSPEGQADDKQSTGAFGWVHNDRTGTNDQPPYPIHFMGVKRGDQLRYAIVDIWNGVRQNDKTLLMSGSRSYVNSQGVVKVEPLGTQAFSK